MMKHAIPILLLAACTAEEPETATAEAPLAITGSCISPTDAPAATPPAIPDDGLDDRAAFQWAINTANTQKKQVCIPIGTFDITFRSLGSLDLNNTDNLTIAGAGNRSIVRFKGVGPGVSGDWWLFYVHGGAENVVFRDFELDGNESVITNVGEQTHGLQIGGCSAANGTVSGVHIHDMTFTHVRGDAVRLCGGAGGGLVSNIDIEHNAFLDNHRTGIGVQRAVQSLGISSNFFASGNDQDIDFEPSDVGGISQFSITSNLMVRDTGCASVALVGFGSADPDFAHHGVFSNNVILGGTLGGYDLQHTVIANNLIVGPVASCSDAVLGLEKYIDDITLSNNILIRPVGAAVGSVLSIVSHNSGIPNHVTIHGDSYTQFVASNIVTMENESNVLFDGVRFMFRNASVGTFAAVTQRPTAVPISGLTVSNSEFDGDLGGGSLMSGVHSSDDHDVGRIVVSGNRGTGLVYGARFDNSNPGVYLDPPVVIGNSWATTSGDFLTFSNSEPILVGGNSGRPALVAGFAPVGACTNGSTYTNANGGVGTTLYVCEASTWHAK